MIKFGQPSNGGISPTDGYTVDTPTGRLVFDVGDGVISAINAGGRLGSGA